MKIVQDWPGKRHPGCPTNPVAAGTIDAVEMGQIAKVSFTEGGWARAVTAQSAMRREAKRRGLALEIVIRGDDLYVRRKVETWQT